MFVHGHGYRSGTAARELFGVDFAGQSLLGVGEADLRGIAGDIMLVQEHVDAGTSGVYVLREENGTLSAQTIRVASGSVEPGVWEHVTFAGAGIVEIVEPPIP